MTRRPGAPCSTPRPPSSSSGSACPRWPRCPRSPRSWASTSSPRRRPARRCRGRRGPRRRQRGRRPPRAARGRRGRGRGRACRRGRRAPRGRRSRNGRRTGRRRPGLMAEERIQKALARAGFGSRRTCEELIVEGRVTLEGRVVTLGDKVDVETQTVEVDGVNVNLDPNIRYYALHKPAGVVTTMSDPQGRPDIRGLLPAEGPRVFPVGRLDRDTEGLLVLTNDGDLANRLMHPSYGIEKEYLAEVEGTPTAEAPRPPASGCRARGRPGARPAREDRGGEPGTRGRAARDDRGTQAGGPPHARCRGAPGHPSRAAADRPGPARRARAGRAPRAHPRGGPGPPRPPSTGSLVPCRGVAPAEGIEDEGAGRPRGDRRERG